ncbi:hypothetical protein [Nocardia sp. NPDC057668]|uniref:hypothetical protein n=1 Tax=Nocardia sp. NPDC057668 TaxID=3346202 RepID=UPI0036735FC1
MTAIAPTLQHRAPTGAFQPATTESRAAAMFTRLTALFAAAGRAVPFHRESAREYRGSTGVTDRDLDRTSMEIRAIASVREHG